MKYGKILPFFFLILSLSRGVFAEERPLENDFSKAGAQVPSQVSISVLDEAQAKDLFRNFTRNKKIAFGYPVEGCYARAHEMAKMAEDQKIIMGKIFVTGHLQAHTEIPEYSPVKWGWHVAPVVYVKSRDGSVKLMVFDPSLFSKPVSVEEFEEQLRFSTMGYRSSISKTSYGSRFQYYPNGLNHEEFKTAWSEDDLYDAKTTMEEFVFNQKPARASSADTISPATGAK